MAVGNTFGATALSSYGGFWISFAIILTPGGFDIVSALTVDGSEVSFFDSFGLFLMVSAPFPAQSTPLARTATKLIVDHSREKPD